MNNDCLLLSHSPDSTRNVPNGKLVAKIYLTKIVCLCYCFMTSKDLANLGSIGTSVSTFHCMDIDSCLAFF